MATEFTEEEKVLLKDVAKEKKAQWLLDIFDANTNAIGAKRVDKHNEILQMIQDGTYELIPDINKLDLNATPEDALPDVVVAKAQADVQ